MIICLGPVCIPAHLLLAFLVGVAHQHGWLTWFKREWVMFSWWRAQFRSFVKGSKEPTPGSPPPPCKASAEGKAEADGADGSAVGGTDGASCCTAGAKHAEGATAAPTAGSASGAGLRTRTALAS